MVSAANGTPGRPEGSSKITLETALDKFVEYRADLHAKHNLRETRAGYRAKVGLSDQGLRDYIKDRNLPWPLLPTDESLLVCLIWGHAPYDITWGNAALAHALRRHPEDLVNKQCALSLLRGATATLSGEHRDLIKQLRSDPTCTEIDSISTELLRADGKWLPVEVYVRYTGPKHDRFYCVARIAGPPRSPEPKQTDISNVDPRYVYTVQRAAPMQLIANPPKPGQFVVDLNPPDQLFAMPTPTVTFIPQTSTLKFESSIVVNNPNVSRFVIHNPQGRNGG